MPACVCARARVCVNRGVNKAQQFAAAPSDPHKAKRGRRQRSDRGGYRRWHGGEACVCICAKAGLWDVVCHGRGAML